MNHATTFNMQRVENFWADDNDACFHCVFRIDNECSVLVNNLDPEKCPEYRDDDRNK